MNGNINVLNEIKNFIEENSIHVNDNEILEHELFLYFKKNVTFVSTLIDCEYEHSVLYECAMLTNEGKKFFYKRTTLPTDAFEFSIYSGNVKIVGNDEITNYISHHNNKNNCFIRININKDETFHLFKTIAQSDDKFLDTYEDCNLVSFWRRLKHVDCLPSVMNKDSRGAMTKILKEMNRKKQVVNVKPITESTVIDVVTEPKVTLGSKVIEDIKHIDIISEVMAIQYKCEDEYYDAKRQKKNLILEVVTLVECKPIIH